MSTKSTKSRKDNKGRVLRPGESQRKDDKRYIYQYTDPNGIRRVIYAVDLLELREKEKKVIRISSDGLDTYVSGKATLNEVFDRYMATKYDLKPQTRVSYKYMYDHFVRDNFGNRRQSMTVWIRSRVQMPNYVKESIRSLVKSICDKDVDMSIALHKE